MIPHVVAMKLAAMMLFLQSQDAEPGEDGCQLGVKALRE